MPKGYAYITSNKQRTVLYTGSTVNLKNRMYKHKKRFYPGFASKYGCDALMYYVEFDKITDAAKREKQIKKWLRTWKWKTIREFNPDLKDLSSDWFDENGELKKE